MRRSIALPEKTGGTSASVRFSNSARTCACGLAAQLRPSDAEVVAFAALKIRGRRESRGAVDPAVLQAKTRKAPASEQVQPGSPRLSLHNGLTAYSVLSPAAHCAPRHCNERLATRRPGRATLPSCNFNASPGRQDHTASPYAYKHRPFRTLVTIASYEPRLGFAPATVPDVPDAFSVHRVPTRACDDGHTSSVGRNEAGYSK
jgi:hypothetical protein